LLRSTGVTKSRTSLGTGGTLLGVAKLYFLVASYATVLALTRFLDPATFGSYSAVGRLIAVPNMVIIYTLMFSVSRPMAAEYGAGNPSYDGIRKRGFRMALTLGGLVSACSSSARRCLPMRSPTRRSRFRSESSRRSRSSTRSTPST